VLREFLSSVLLRCELGSAYVCSLPNVKGRGRSERHVLTRDLDKIEDFVRRHDEAGRGCFFSVGTIADGSPRRKDHFQQICAIHADVDFKDVEGTPEEIRFALLNLPHQPAWQVETGNGMHLYWLLDRPTGDYGEVESVLKDVCRAVGGDPTVAHVVALMRLPGSHNTKNGAWTEVRAVPVPSGGLEALALDELRGWPQLVRRKGREVQQNPFLRFAEQVQFKPPMDVDERLEGMTHKGDGESGIHNTQLAVVASLLEQGWEIRDVVRKVLEATRKAVADDPAWNWAKEEETVNGMAEDWQRKRARDKPKKKSGDRKMVDVSGTANDQTSDAGTGSSSTGDAEVVSLDSHRLKKVAGKVAKGDVHAIIGAGILAQLEANNKRLIRTADGMWLCEDGLWTMFRPDDWKAWAGRKTEDGCHALKLICNNKITNETRGWIERCPEIWIDEVPWDEHGMIATRSGLIDHRTGEVVDLTAGHYVTHWVDADYDPDARCRNWEKMLKDAGFDDPTKGVVQEILGCALVDKKPRALMRALVMVGGSNTGKSNILRVMAKLLTNKPITTPLDAMENAHGTVDFLRRAPWLLDEAFDQAKWHVSSTVKALLSGDYVNVNVKNGPMISHQWRGAVFWGSNVPPQFKEVSRAMENRLVIIKCEKVFDPARPTGVAKLANERGYVSPAELVLAEEKSGVLNWAFEGLRRAWDRGYIEMTQEVLDSLKEMRLDANIAAGFFEECVDFSPDHMVTAPDLYAAFCSWWIENSDRQIPSPKSFGRAVAGLADNRVVPTGLRHNMVRVRAGIKLNPTGLDHWQAQFNSSAVRGGGTERTSTSANEVNRTIPSTWDENEQICSMRQNHSDGQ
jgi:P4 family phage/plasmid primase-like protien